MWQRTAGPLVALIAVVQASLYGESNLNHTCQLRASLCIDAHRWKTLTDVDQKPPTSPAPVMRTLPSQIPAAPRPLAGWS